MGVPMLAAMNHLEESPASLAGASREARQRLLNEVAENVRAFIEGRPRNVIG